MMGLKAVKTSAGTSRFLWLPVWRQRLIMLDEIPLRPVVLVNFPTSVSLQKRGQKFFAST